jgi:hypothetical protein
MSLGPGNRSIRLWIPFAATCAMQSYSLRRLKVAGGATPGSSA